MAYATSGIVGTRLDEANDSALFTLGQVVQGTDGTEWMYCVASGAVTAYQAVGINEDYDTYGLTTALAAQSDRVGFAQFAMSSGQYGFVAVKGSNIKVRTKASCAADSQLWTTASAGVLDDATAAGAYKIDGVVCVAAAGTAANGAAGIEVKASWPAIRET